MFGEEIDDLFSCPVCMETLNEPMLLECSHIICKGCLDEMFENKKNFCPICKQPVDKDKIIKPELIYIIIKFYNLLKSCTDVFLNYPLSFKYCVDCKVFITNYSIKKHKSQKHYLFTFDKILQTYFEGKNICFDNDMFIVLYFYLNPFLHEIKCLEQKGNSFNFGNENFIFYGKQRNLVENKFLMKLMKNKYEVTSEAIKWYKGTLINKKNWFFIHGFFLIKSIKSEPYIQPNIFGFLSYGDIKFFGFIKVNKKYIYKTDPLEVKDFILDCGILFNKHYYFGKFNDINIETLSKIEKDDSNIKILNGGEIFYIKEKGIEIKRLKREIIEEEIPIMTCEMESNKLILYYEYKDERANIEIEPFYIQVDKNNIPQPFEEYELANCKINFRNYNRSLIFDRSEYKIYLFKNEENKDLQINKFKTKVLSINLTEDILQFLDLKSRIIKHIKNENAKDKNNFYCTLKKILEMKVNKCIIKYHLSEIKDGEIKINEDDYHFEISGCEVKPKGKKMEKKQNQISHRDINLKNIETIEDFLKFELTSEIYNFRDKEEAICSVCGII